MLTTIRLYGKLGKKYGKIFKMDVHSIGETIKALSVNLPGFIKDIADGKYIIIRDNINIPKEEILAKFNSKTIKIIPYIEGSKSAGSQIIVGALLIAASAGAGSYLAGLELTGFNAAAASFVTSAATAIGSSLVVAGVTQLLFKPPKTPKTSDSPSSFIFNGQVNTISQGK